MMNTAPLALNVCCLNVPDLLIPRVRKHLANSEHPAPRMFSHLNPMLKSIQQDPPEAVVVGTAKGRDTALDRITDLSAHHPKLPVLLLADQVNLGFAIRAQRQGVNQLVPTPVDDDDLGLALRQMARTAGKESPFRFSLAVTGSTGGAGVTTVAANLALELYELIHGKITLMDLDLTRGGATTYFDITPEHSLVEIGQTGDQIDAHLLNRAISSLPCGINLLPAIHKMGVNSIATEAISQVMTILARQGDILVVDLPLGVDEKYFSCLAAAKPVVLLVEQTVPSVRSAQRILRSMEEMGLDPGVVRLVANRYTDSSESIREKELSSIFPSGVFHTLPNDPTPAIESENFGQPLNKKFPDSPLRLAIRDLAEKLLALRGWAKPNQERPRGLLEKLTGLFCRPSTENRKKHNEEIHILLVEDSATFRGYYRKVLARIGGYKGVFIEADSPQSAREAIETKPFDLAIVDYCLAGPARKTVGTGIDVVEAIRQHDKNVPILVVSGRADAEIFSQMIRVGADDYMEKGPKLLQEIKPKVEALLDNSGKWEQFQTRLNTIGKTRDRT